MSLFFRRARCALRVRLSHTTTTTKKCLSLRHLKYSPWYWYFLYWASGKFTVGARGGSTLILRHIYSPSCTKNIHCYFLKFSALVGVETCVASWARYIRSSKVLCIAMGPWRCSSVPKQGWRWEEAVNRLPYLLAYKPLLRYKPPPQERVAVLTFFWLISPPLD